MNKVVKRESSFELLRIISMLFIIGHHFIVHSNYDFVNNNASLVNNFIVALFQAGGKFGVAIFSMITGYFMIKSSIKLVKIFMLEGRVLFYSVGLFLLFYFFGREFVTGDYIKFFMPNIYQIYWFFSSYFILYLLLPFVNRLLLRLSKRWYLFLLIIGFIFLIMIPFIFRNMVIRDGTIYVIYYYLVGAFIRLFGDKFCDKKYYLGGFIIFYLLMAIFAVIMRESTVNIVILRDNIWMFSSIDSIFVFISAICLFLYFKNLDIRENRLINLVASVSFGVYLFHDHPFMRDYLFNKLFLVEKLVLKSNFLFSGILIVCLIYLLGGIIEFLRQVIVKYFLSKKGR